jgi:Rieske Fe-S protein
MTGDDATVPSAGGLTRRKALSIFIAGAMAAIAGVLASLLGRFFVGRAAADSLPRVRSVAAGPVSRFEASTEPVEAVLSFAETQGYYSESRRKRVFLFTENGRLTAFSSTCSHLGCSVSWDSRKGLFLCPCHGGAYRKDGSVAGGPPPRPLKRLPIEIDRGTVFVNLDETA